MKVTKIFSQSQKTERDTRIKDTPAVPNEPTDHAVTRGRDVSLRDEGGHNPENHTVVLETTDGPQRQRTSQTTQSAEHVVVNYTTKKPEHLPRANDHEGRSAE